MRLHRANAGNRNPNLPWRQGESRLQSPWLLHDPIAIQAAREGHPCFNLVQTGSNGLECQVSYLRMQASIDLWVYV